MAEIKDYNGRPAIHVNGEIIPPMMATIRTNNRENMCIDKEYYRELGKAGIRIFFLICDTEWLKPSAFEQFREEAETLLEVCPDAYIITRIGLHPNNEWIKNHPDEVLTYSDGSKPPVHLFSESYETDLPAHYSLCSEKWREDAGVALCDTWKKIKELPYGNRVIGCFFAAGGTSEWYYMHPIVNASGATLDHSEAFRKNFSKYLNETYKSDAALRKSWKRDDVTIEHPAIPGADGHYYARQADIDANQPRERMYANSPVPPPYGNGSNIGSFIDFDNRRDVYDFYRAWHIGTAQSNIYFARLIKSLNPDALIGTFYGAHGCTEFLQTGTNGGTNLLLNCKDIDFLAAPGVYENRQPGGFVGQREMHDSFALRNKIYIIEDDTRTHLENRYWAPKNGMYDLTDSLEVMKREFGRTICEDVHAWWFDQILGGRRYKHPEIYKLISKQQKIAKAAYELDRRKASEIAFIYDEESIASVSPATTKELIERVRNYEIARIGAPVDQYYHNDLNNPDMPDYKLYIFFNTFVLTDAEREQIKKKLAKNNAVAIWMYASGIINPDKEQKFDPANIKELTGIEIEMLLENYDANFRFTGEHDLVNGLDRRKVYGDTASSRNSVSGVADAGGWSVYLYPYFYANDTDATTCASFLTSGKDAIAIKEHDGFRSVFYGSKSINSAVIRRFAEYAGVHIYTDAEDVFFANKNYITIHASESGKKIIKLNRRCDVYEVYEEKYYAKDTDEFTFEMDFGVTKMFKLI